mmetsp:Transcript_27465/g.64388  ORF Transcript_27465/g.64388 Transcript_27465/m.64388 type:complete len:503 (-) Transcript_27465:133-1641(-)
MGVVDAEVVLVTLVEAHRGGVLAVLPRVLGASKGHELRPVAHDLLPFANADHLPRGVLGVHVGLDLDHVLSARPVRAGGRLREGRRQQRARASRNRDVVALGSPRSLVLVGKNDPVVFVERSVGALTVSAAQTVPVAVGIGKRVGYVGRSHGEADFSFVPRVRLVELVPPGRQGPRRVGDGQGRVLRVIVGDDFDGEFLALFHDLYPRVAVLLVQEDDLDGVDAAVEIGDHESFARLERGHFRGLAVHVGGAVLLADDGDHVPVFVGVPVDPLRSVVPDVEVLVLGRLLQSEDDESVVVASAVIRDAVELEFEPADAVEGVDRRGLVRVPPELVALLRVVAFSRVIAQDGAPHEARRVSVLIVPIAGELSAVREAEVVADLVHLGRHLRALKVVVEGVLAAGIREGHEGPRAGREAEHDEAEPPVLEVAELRRGRLERYLIDLPRISSAHVEIGSDVDDPTRNVVSVVGGVPDEGFDLELVVRAGLGLRLEGHGVVVEDVVS